MTSAEGEPMRVLITGGTGLIGRALSASLLSDGHEVVDLSRDPDPASPLPERAQAVRWDARTSDGWGTLVNDTDAIINLAGASVNHRWTPRYKRLIRDSRVEAGRAVVEAVAQATRRPQLVIQASGAGYYGSRDDEVVTEQTGAGDGFLGRTALAWEDSTAPVETMGVRRAVIRTGIVLSEKGGAFPLMSLPFRLFLGGPLGDGRQWLPWIHMDDEVRAIRFLMQHSEAAGPFNLTAPQPVTNAQFARHLGQAMRRPACLRVPAWVLRLAMGEMSTVVLTGQRAVPRRLLNLGFAFRFPALHAALYELPD